MDILVTGYKGFIGHNMMAWLHSQGHSVDGFDWGDEFPDIKKYDWVVHLGAIADMTETNVDKVLHQNLEFSQNLYLECQNNGVNLQYASSSSVYGNSKDQSEYAPCYPQTPYAWSKYLFDRWVFDQKPTIMVQGFRYFNVYGKWMHLRGTRANAIHKWRTQARKDGYIDVWENAEHIHRDWTWVGDVCRLHTDFMDTVKGSGIWNCGAGLAHSFLDIAEAIAEQEGVEIKTISRPDTEQPRFRQKTCANLKHLKETVGKRSWLNVYEWLDLES
jgi:ADP-L-glycero-D-manno-heptose 6-epimerase